MRRPLLVPIVGCAVALLVTGCSDPLDQAVGEALSATRTARLVVQQEDRGLSFPTTVSVTLQDAGDTVADASRQLAVDPAATASERDAVRAAVDALDLARSGSPRASTALETAIRRLEALP